MSFILNRISNMSILPPNIDRQSSQLSLNIPGTQSRQQLFHLRTVTIRNAKRQSFHQKKVIILESLINLINVLAVTITILKNFKVNTQANETILNYTQEQQNEKIQYMFLLVFSIFAAVLNFVKNICLVQLEQQAEQAYENGKHTNRYWIKMVFQTIFYLVHPSAFTDGIMVDIVHPPISLNNIFSCILYLRFVEILLFLLKLSRFFGLRVKRVLGLYIGDKNDLGILYTIKCLLKQNGLKSPFFIYGAIITILPFFIISLQQKFNSEQNQFTSYDAFLQAIYDIIISMATIGYGDMEHQHLFERVILIVVIILGSITTSFFTLTFLKWFKLTEQEEKALKSIKRLLIKSDLQEINIQKVNKFVLKFIELKKKRKEMSQNQLKQKKQNRQQTNSWQMANNQILAQQINQRKLSTFLPSIKNPEIKFINERLNDKQDSFKDFYEKNQIELSQSIKILIERTLLTNNLLQFYLMRQKSGKSSYVENSLIADSSETIKSRKRVDDSVKMHEIRLNIIKNKYEPKIQPQNKGDICAKQCEI